MLGISKRGIPYLRRLIIHGARSCVAHLNRERDRLGHWLDKLGQRMHRNKVIVALANKIGCCNLFRARCAPPWKFISIV